MIGGHCTFHARNIPPAIYQRLLPANDRPDLPSVDHVLSPFRTLRRRIRASEAWFIGLAIIIVADAFLLLRTDEGAPELAQQAALIVIPVVALVLMFLMFKSQK